MEERPGPVHLELPEDIAAEESPPTCRSCPPHPIDRPVAHPTALDRAAAMILAAKRPLIMIGAGGNRPRLVEPLCRASCAAPASRSSTRRWARASSPAASNLYMGTAALSERDYVHHAIDQADLIITIGHDTVEKPPFIMGAGGPQGDPHRLHVRQGRAGLLPARRGDRRHRREPGAAGGPARRQARRRPDCSTCAQEILDAHQRPRATRTASRSRRSGIVHDVRKVMPEDGIVCLDNGMYKIWFARNYRTHVRQHAAARQRARDHGRGAAVGHDGRRSCIRSGACWRSAATAAS